MMDAPHLDVPGRILLILGVMMLALRNIIFPFTRLKPSKSIAIGLALIIGGILMLFVT